MFRLRELGISVLNVRALLLSVDSLFVQCSLFHHHLSRSIFCIIADTRNSVKFSARFLVCPQNRGFSC